MVRCRVRHPVFRLMVLTEAPSRSIIRLCDPSLSVSTRRGMVPLIHVAAPKGSIETQQPRISLVQTTDFSALTAQTSGASVFGENWGKYPAELCSAAASGVYTRKLSL